MTIKAADPVIVDLQEGLTASQPKLNAALQAMGETNPYARGVTNIDDTDSPYTAAAPGVYHCDATAGAITFNLPDCAGNSEWCIVVIKTDASGNAVTVTRAGADTIEGATTVSLASQYAKTAIDSVGTAVWYKRPGV